MFLCLCLPWPPSLFITHPDPSCSTLPTFPSTSQYLPSTQSLPVPSTLSHCHHTQLQYSWDQPASLGTTNFLYTCHSCYMTELLFPWPPISKFLVIHCSKIQWWNPNPSIEESHELTFHTAPLQFQGVSFACRHSHRSKCEEAWVHTSQEFRRDGKFAHVGLFMNLVRCRMIQ